MAFQFLQTKLFVPPPRADAVVRARLVDRLAGGLRRGARLTLVSAPAGFGKSSLLAQWVDQERRVQQADAPVFAWLSLERSENEPARFWVALAAALDSAVPGAGALLAQAARAIPMPGLDAPEELFAGWADAVLVPFLNEIGKRPDRLALVLDDYHVIENPLLQAGLGFLVEHFPPNLHLVIATRADPPLPLHRMRARGLLTELRAADLRFSLEEAGQFLRGRLGLPASDADLRALEARTEGWAAGLQMAGLALQALRSGPHSADGQTLAEFMESFSGSHQYVIDYLAEEVLDRLPADTQQFLLNTAILDRFTAGLCDELRKPGEGSEQESRIGGMQGSAAILASLEQNNLFLVPLDSTRTWYRYHHLFADLLQARLRQTAPGRIAGLHCRAAAWLEEQGLDDEAFAHAAAGEDWQRAGRLIKRGWQRLGHTGLADVALEWLGKLPREHFLSDSEFPSATAWMLHVRGRYPEMARYIDEAAGVIEGEIETGRLTPGSYEYRESVGQLAALRGIEAARRGDIASAEKFANQVLETIPPEYALIQGIGRNMLAGVLRARGQYRAADQEMVQAVRLLREGRNFIAEAIAIYYRTRVLLSLGRLAEAEQSVLEGMDAAQASGVNRSPVFGMLEIALGEIRREQDRLDEAETLAESGLRRGTPAGVLEAIRQGGVLRARLFQARGDVHAATAALQQTRTVLNRLKIPQAGLAEVEALDAWLQLQAGQRPAALAWAARLLERPAGAPRLDLETMVLARVWLAEGRAEDARRLLEDWLPALEADPRSGDLAQGLLLRALALEAGNPAAARADLTRALELGRSAGLRRTFLDEGQAGLRLLEAWRRATQRSGDYPELCAYLSDFVDPAEEPVVEPQAGSPGNQGLVEPLSERELEILRLMAGGLSNRQIGDQLYLALGTVKTHVHNISGKLGAQNRVQAIAIAREKGLLE